MKNSKQLGEYGILAFCTSLVAAVKEGWDMDEWNPPMDLGGYFVCTVEREEPEGGFPPKPTRGDILAIARAAKKAKAEAPAQTPETAQEPSEAVDQGQGSPEAPSDAPAPAETACQPTDEAPKSE